MFPRQASLTAKHPWAAVWLLLFEAFMEGGVWWSSVLCDCTGRRGELKENGVSQSPLENAP